MTALAFTWLTGFVLGAVFGYLSRSLFLLAREIDDPRYREEDY